MTGSSAPERWRQHAELLSGRARNPIDGAVVSRPMLDIVIPSLAVLAAAWTLVSALRRQRAIAAGAATSTAVLSLAWAAGALNFDPWMEGGFGMNLLAIAGSYTLGAAVASRLSSSRGPRMAAIVGVVLTALIGAGFYVQALVVVDEAVRHAEPEVAALIREAGAAEAVRTVQLAGIVGGLALAIMLTRPRRGRRVQLEHGERIETGPQTHQMHGRPPSTPSSMVLRLALRVTE